MYKNGKKKKSGFRYVANYKGDDMRQTVAIIKYNAGNVQSVLFALEKYNVHAILTDDHEIIKAADKVLFPGVGEASTTMNYLKQKGLNTLIPSLKQPVLGICLGLQLMCTHTEENNTDCLGILPIQVKRFEVSDGHKVPHMGWNQLKISVTIFAFVIVGIKKLWHNHPLETILANLVDVWAENKVLLDIKISVGLIGEEQLKVPLTEVIILI